jgi:uncharacterized membrane protein
MIRGSHCIVAAASATLMLAATPAHAELMLCNRTSYVMEIAFGIEKRANVSTYGWFRVDPGQCRQVLDTPLDADMVYVHMRASPVYGSAPLPQNGEARFCIRDSAFAITDARGCPANQQVRFTAAKPSDSPQGPAVNLAEEADYDATQARLAGIQRLLAIAGYEAYPIDGVQGAKTQGALTKFLNDRNLPADAPAKPDFFDILLKAAANPEGTGFTWCNDTRYPVMAALGVVEMGAIVTRGWYRVAAGPMPAAGPARRPAPAVQLRRGGRRQWPHRHARRCTACVGRKCSALHPRRQVRTRRPQGLCGARPEHGRFCGRRFERPARDNRPVPGTLGIKRLLFRALTLLCGGDHS